MNIHDGNCLWTEMKAICSEIIFMILESEKCAQRKFWHQVQIQFYYRYLEIAQFNSVGGLFKSWDRAALTSHFLRDTEWMWFRREVMWF